MEGGVEVGFWGFGVVVFGGGGGGGWVGLRGWRRGGVGVDGPEG